MNRRDLLSSLTMTAASLRSLAPGARFRLGRDLHRQLGPHRDRPAGRPALVARLAELVLPRTDTPGALDVGVPEFIEALMAGWYSPAEREAFLRGLGEIDRRAGATGFAGLPEKDQIGLLTALDGAAGEPGSAEAAFATVKELTIFGYFTSERVQKDVLRSPVIPGRFDGCAPFGHR